MTTFKLNLYTISMKYVRDLHNDDDKVQSVSPQINKSSRPFVGIVIIVGEKQYCIPLDSPKAKHHSMNNDIDFMKMTVDNKLLGVLNLNNMIPVNENLIQKIDLRPNRSDRKDTASYKNLCRKELDWIRKHQDQIISKANRLYLLIIQKKAPKKLADRCLDFKKLESVLEKWNNKN